MSGTQETALTLARELSGAGEAEEALLELLCQAAEQQWEKRLRPVMTTDDGDKAVPCAVAFTAAADLAAARGVRFSGVRLHGGQRVRADPRRGGELRFGGEPAAHGGTADGTLCGAGRFLLSGSERMTDWVRQVLERYGQDVTVDTADGERTVRAFLQPMTERDERARSDVTSIGWVDGRLWLYLGQTALEEGEALAWEATRFRVRSCRPYYIGNALSHYWAALEQEREAAECGS